MTTHKRFCLTALALLSLVTGAAIAAQPPIYKCAQPDGTTLYSDFACERGTLVDVHPGQADPNAQERLSRAQGELDRGAARRANEQEAAARQQELNQLRRQQEAAQNMTEPSTNGADVFYGTGYDTYGPYPEGRMQRPNYRGGARGHRRSIKDRVQGRLPAVIRRPHAPE
jgi:hypothetical protein